LIEVANFKKKIIRVASRGSKLAFSQTTHIINELKNKFPKIDFPLIQFKTLGDKVQNRPLSDFRGIGIFVKELESALLNNKADFAVHSLKDVPTDIHSDLALFSYPERENPRDIFLCGNTDTIDNIKKDCQIGTGSPRRQLQIKAILPAAKFKDIRGNIDTRIKKLNNKEYDAIIVAYAGMKRLGKSFPESSILSINQCMPAIGQGALVIECRKDDLETIEIIKSINDRYTEMTVSAEREFMKIFGGGCKNPLACYARINQNKLFLSAMAGNLQENRKIRLDAESTLNNSLESAKNLAKQLISKLKKEKIDLIF
jgi:hydroxymethylbilane synthase